MPYKHGHNRKSGSSPEYHSWSSMKQRCLNPNHDYYPAYGGNGVTICDEWTNSFEKFLEDMGPRPKGTSLDRRDNSKGYCKENCQWATRAHQQVNRNNSKFHTFQGETLCLAEWARKYTMPYNTLDNRIKAGWSIEKALLTPRSPSSLVREGLLKQSKETK
jgi:hypothetical protein